MTRSPSPEAVQDSVQIASDLPNASSTKPALPSVTVTKPIPYTFDLGNLLLHDANPLPYSPTPSQISSCARDCAQALINQLLTTCPIKTTSSSSTSGRDGVSLTLPPPTFPLPREKPLPKPKAPTKWEAFAAKKGIGHGRKKGEGKMVYDEQKGEWVPKWGYKGKNKDGEEDWIVEVDEKQERDSEAQGKTLRGQARRDRVEKVKRNERARKANDRRGDKNKAGR